MVARICTFLIDTRLCRWAVSVSCAFGDDFRGGSSGFLAVRRGTSTRQRLGTLAARYVVVRRTDGVRCTGIIVSARVHTRASHAGQSRVAVGVRFAGGSDALGVRVAFVALLALAVGTVGTCKAVGSEGTVVVDETGVHALTSTAHLVVSTLRVHRAAN